MLRALHSENNDDFVNIPEPELVLKVFIIWLNLINLISEILISFHSIYLKKLWEYQMIIYVVWSMKMATLI